MLLTCAIAVQFRQLHKDKEEAETAYIDHMISYSEQLDHTVQERTAELKVISKQLKNASEAKSQFLANMSHEIRTPLTSVIGYAEALLEGEIPEKKRDSSLSVIANNGKLLLRLVNNILDISKIEAHQLEVESADVQLMKLFNQLSHVIGNLASKKKLIL